MGPCLSKKTAASGASPAVGAPEKAGRAARSSNANSSVSNRPSVDSAGEKLVALRRLDREKSESDVALIRKALSGNVVCKALRDREFERADSRIKNWGQNWDRMG